MPAEFTVVGSATGTNGVAGVTLNVTISGSVSTNERIFLLGFCDGASLTTTTTGWAGGLGGLFLYYAGPGTPGAVEVRFSAIAADSPYIVYAVKASNVTISTQQQNTTISGTGTTATASSPRPAVSGDDRYGILTFFLWNGPASETFTPSNGATVLGQAYAAGTTYPSGGCAGAPNGLNVAALGYAGEPPSGSTGSSLLIAGTWTTGAPAWLPGCIRYSAGIFAWDEAEDTPPDPNDNTGDNPWLDTHPFMGYIGLAFKRGQRILWKRSPVPVPPFEMSAYVTDTPTFTGITDKNPCFDIIRDIGRVQVAFERTGGTSPGIYLAYSDDDGETWTVDGTRTMQGSHPIIRTHPVLGTQVLIAYRSSKLYGAIKEPSDTTFGTEFTLTDENGADIAADDDGAALTPASDTSMRWYLTVRQSSTLKTYQSWDDCRTWTEVV